MNMTNYIIPIKSFFIFTIKNIIMMIILVLSSLYYINISYVFASKFMLYGLENFSLVFSTWSFNFFFIVMLSLPIVSTNLCIFLLSKSSIKFYIKRFIVNSTLLSIFHYLCNHYSNYIKPAFNYIMSCTLFLLFINFIVSIRDYFIDLKSNMLTIHNVKYLVAFGLLFNLGSDYYYTIFTWYCFTVCLLYLECDEKILCNHPMLKTWLRNILIINITILELTLMSFITTAIFTAVKVVWGYIVKMDPFSNNNGTGEYNNGGSNEGPGGNGPHQPEQPEILVESKKDRHNRLNREKYQNRTPEQKERHKIKVKKERDNRTEQQKQKIKLSNHKNYLERRAKRTEEQIKDDKIKDKKKYANRTSEQIELDRLYGKEIRKKKTPEQKELDRIRNKNRTNEQVEKYKLNNQIKRATETKEEKDLYNALRREVRKNRTPEEVERDHLHADYIPLDPENYIFTDYYFEDIEDYEFEDIEDYELNNITDDEFKDKSAFNEKGKQRRTD